MLGQLADIETNHKDRLFDLYQSIADSPVDRENVEAERIATVMEGGFTADQVLDIRQYACGLKR